MRKLVSVISQSTIVDYLHIANCYSISGGDLLFNRRDRGNPVTADNC